MTTTKDTASKERRRWRRFKSYSILQLMDSSARLSKKDPTLVNMSVGGLCFYCDDYLHLNDRIQFRISITEFNSVVECYARIAWTQRSTEHVGAFFTGAEFVDLNESDRDVIRRLEKATRPK